MLGRMAAGILELPTVGERHVVVGWPVGEEGRKRHAGSALYGPAGDVRSIARSTWIVPAA
jgi:hypothetical protein